MRPPSRVLRPALLFLFAAACLLPANAQANSPASAHPALPLVDETRLVTLRGTVHPFAQKSSDRGPVEPDFRANRLLLTLARPAEREQALQQFLHDAHSPVSKSFHQWLTPQQFGDRFGVRDEDRRVVTAWLESHGLSVDRIASNRSTIEFSGTAAQVRDALHTEIHRYAVEGKTLYANAQELSVPEAIRSRIAGFVPINSVPLESYATPVGPATFSRDSRKARLDIPGTSPDTDLTSNNQPFYALGPEDFATQYNVAPVYAAGNTGAGQTIGIIGTSNINLALVDSYRTLFNLPASRTQVVVDGTDPGDPLAPNIEAFLDVEVSGAVAPAASVNLYIAGGQPLSNSLELAALRAVEDNEASVLSVSYGNCEQLIGSANQFWSGLWEQAAAQGQTVFVSSGDTGPTTCTLGEVNSIGNIVPVSTLSVNGISSTPWNVSVGGTDFYYADYAAGAPSISSLWNSTNDASKGSLKAPLPEQPWDNALGLNINPSNFQAASFPSVAGGGGVSNCSTAVSSGTSTLPICVSGYSKPDWQVAPGVPDDQARDLPDVSLFAANAANLSAWPICADPGDCTPSSTGRYHVFLVGGTSASSPAMAGVMALIDQKYGRQGQANFTLYALARQDPAVFHDITVGTNDVVCYPDSGALCATPVPSFPVLNSFGLYPASAGYDLATGLGSLDVGKLFADWNTVPGTATSTTLQVSPATFVHGASATVTASVSASSGSAVPTGNVALVSSTATLRDNPAIALSSGTAASTLVDLPGGTYTLTAQYSGDATFAPSTSSPVTLTVTPEPSSLALNMLLPITHTPVFGSVGSQPYGSTFTFGATPSGTSGAPPLAAGTVTFTDGSTTTTVPVSANGVAAWTPQTFALGSHSITAAYSGDASYSASTATPLAITVIKGNPAFSAVPEAGPQVDVSLGQPAYTAGSDLVVHVLLRTSKFSAAPTGSVTVNLGSMTQTVTLNSNEYLSGNLSNAFVTFASVPAGAYIISATYSGDSNWNASSFTSGTQLIFAATGAVPTTTALTLSPAAVDSSGSVSVSATVTGTAAPSSPVSVGSIGRVVLFGNGTAITSILVRAVQSSGVYTGSATIPATVFPLGTLQIVGVYIGGAQNTPSTSPPVALTVTASDFSLTVAASALTVKSGQSATVPLQLAGPAGAGVPVTLSCASASTAIGCTISPGSATVTGTATATLTINAFTTSTTAKLQNPALNEQFRPGHAATLALVLFLVLPLGRRRRLSTWPRLLVLLLAAASVFTGCSGGSSHSPTPTPTPAPTQTNAPVGAYTVKVKGVSGGIEHITTITFQIQK